MARLFHAIENITGAVFPYWTTRTGRWISFAILLVPAAAHVLPQLQRQRKARVEVDTSGEQA